MKALRVVLLCAAAALPQLAQADLSITDPAGLGVVRAYVNFCTTVDPQNAPAYRTEWLSIVSHSPHSLLVNLEANSNYWHGYNSTTVKLRKLPAATAVQECAAGAAQWK